MTSKGTTFRSLLTDLEIQQLKEAAERQGRSPRGFRDYVLREAIRKDQESQANRVAQ